MSKVKVTTKENEKIVKNVLTYVKLKLV